MENNSVIYWFSGTGNSLYAAKRLAKDLDMGLAQITNEPPGETAGGSGAKVGFVFPSYYGNLPRAVKKYAETLEIRKGTYIFAVVTMGGLGQGSVGALVKALKLRDLHLDYGRSVLMPANYILKYNPADPEDSEAKLERADKHLKKISAEIASGLQSIRMLPVTAGNLYKSIESLDAGFAAGDGCTGCGTCERICPAGNIRIENGRPKWLNICEQCVACISWCPEKAIEYGEKTQGRRRYRNPRVEAAELLRK